MNKAPSEISRTLNLWYSLTVYFGIDINAEIRYSKNEPATAFIFCNNAHEYIVSRPIEWERKEISK